MKNNHIKKGKPPQENPEEDSLEREIDDIIDREKTKRRIVSKLLKQSIQSAPKDRIK
jgi:hypothetical protein